MYRRHNAHLISLPVRRAEWPEPKHWLIPCAAEDPRRISRADAEYLLRNGYYGILTQEDR